MVITIGILCVDGKTLMELKTTDPIAAKEFLKVNDHEGSRVILSVDTDNPDEVYRLLNFIQPRKKGT